MATHTDTPGKLYLLHSWGEITAEEYHRRLDALKACAHGFKSREDAGYEKDGIRQTVMVCHDCGAILEDD